MSARDEAVDATLLASRALLGVVARSIDPVLHRVTMPQFRVLVVLCSNGGLRIGALAAEMRANPSTFSRTIDRMERNGWVRREASTDSRREVLVHATDAGRSLVDEVTASRREEIARILAKLSSDEIQIIAGALSSFADAAGEASARDLLTLGL